MKTPLYWLPPFLKFCPTPLPRYLQPLPPLLFLMSCFFGWVGDRATFDVLFYDVMDLYMSTVGTLVPEGPYYVFYAGRCHVFWDLTRNVVFCLYSDLISHKQTLTQVDTVHSGANRKTHPYKYLLAPPVTG